MWPSTRCAFERECASGNLKSPSQANAAAPHHDPCDTLQTGLNTPSILSRQQQKELLELAVQSVQVSKQLTLSRKAVSACPHCKRIAVLHLGGSKQRRSRSVKGTSQSSPFAHSCACCPPPAPPGAGPEDRRNACGGQVHVARAALDRGQLPHGRGTHKVCSSAVQAHASGAQALLRHGDAPAMLPPRGTWRLPYGCRERRCRYRAFAVR